ncbi:CHASE2 domain-containing protein, partial [bacterium]|nr:CHASE2 domain-containing protein [bacterium]
LKLPFGLLADPPDEFGMHRYQYTKVAAGDSSYPSLEAAAAGRFTEAPVKTESPVLINFLGREGGIPHVSLDRALGGGLIPELVRGKSVIIGFSGGAYEPRLRTPLAGGSDIALLDYRGYALDTLIAQGGIAEAPLAVQFMFVALIVFTGLVLQTLFEMRFLTWLTLAAVAGFLGGSWLLLVFGHVWLPVTEPLVAFSLTFLLIFRQRVLLAEEAVNTMLLNLSAKLKQRVMPESFYTSQEYWSQVITMVNQTLNLTRAIFLEKVPGDHRVREVKALHCSITDISEQRRDYERTPYSTAIESGGPIRIERDYLTRSGTPEDQYLVPLIFGGQPLGFWAFGINPETAAKIPYFDGTI